MRTCSRTGCTKPHRAKGLCSTHYNQRDPQRHAPQPVVCAACGTIVWRRVHTDRRHVCSATCRAAVQYGTGAGTGTWSWTDMAMRRAKRLGATVVEPVDRLAVFARDGWTCYLCDTVLAPDADPFDLLSATVDHVRSLRRGGQHTMANVRCACLGCNSRKQDRSAA